MPGQRISDLPFGLPLTGAEYLEFSQVIGGVPTSIRAPYSSIMPAIGNNEIAFGDPATGALTSNPSFYRNPSNGYIGIGGVPLPYASLDVKGVDSSPINNAFYLQNQSTTGLFRVDNGGNVFLNNIASLNGSGNIAVIGGANLLWGSGGGIQNAALMGCYSNYHDIHFGNNYGIEGAGRIAIGDNSYMGTYAGGVSNYMRFTRLSGNSNLDLQKVTAPADGGFMFVQAFPYKEDALAYVGKNDKLQFFTDRTWTMPMGGYKGQLDCTKTFSVSATYDDTEIAAIVNDYSDTKRILAAVIQHLGNHTTDVGFDDSNNYIYLPGHNLVGRQRVRFIGGSLPPEIVANTWYFLCDTIIDVDNFQITGSIGGSPLDFSAPAPGTDPYMEIEFSGLNLLG